MITLQNENNTVLLYRNLVKDELPTDVQVKLVSRDGQIQLDSTTTFHTHFYLVSFVADLSQLPSEVIFSVSVNGLVYYTEKARIKR